MMVHYSVFVLKGEIRPSLCQCVIIPSLHEDLSEPFSFNILPDLMFSSEIG